MYISLILFFGGIPDIYELLHNFTGKSNIIPLIEINFLWELL